MSDKDQPVTPNAAKVLLLEHARETEKSLTSLQERIEGRLRAQDEKISNARYYVLFTVIAAVVLGSYGIYANLKTAVTERIEREFQRDDLKVDLRAAAEGATRAMLNDPVDGPAWKVVREEILPSKCQINRLTQKVFFLECKNKGGEVRFEYRTCNVPGADAEPIPIPYPGVDCSEAGSDVQ